MIMIMIKNLSKGCDKASFAFIKFICVPILEHVASVIPPQQLDLIMLGT